jgi:hypothetical protein
MGMALYRFFYEGLSGTIIQYVLAISALIVAALAYSCHAAGIRVYLKKKEKRNIVDIEEDKEILEETSETKN